MRQVTPSESVLAELGTYDPARGMTAAQRNRSRTAQRLIIEHGVTGALSHSFDLQQAAPLIVQAVCDELGWACGACWIEDASTDTLLCVGTWGRGGPAIDAFLKATRTIRPSASEGGGLVRRAVAVGRPGVDPRRGRGAELLARADGQARQPAQRIRVPDHRCRPRAGRGRVLQPRDRGARCRVARLHALRRQPDRPVLPAGAGAGATAREREAPRRHHRTGGDRHRPRQRRRPLRARQPLDVRPARLQPR